MSKVGAIFQEEPSGFTTERGTSVASHMDGSVVGASALGPNATALGFTIVNQGLSFTETEKLFGLLFEQNFPRLQEAARAEARRRVDEFAATFTRIAAAQQVTEEQLGGFAEPDVQLMLNSAIQTSARRDSRELRDVLARLIVRRLQDDNEELMSLVLGEAVVAASKLTSNQLQTIALCFVTNEMDWFGGPRPRTWQNCDAFLDVMVAPFLSTPVSMKDILHIEYAGGGVMIRARVHPLSTIIEHQYGELFEGDDLRNIQRDPDFAAAVISRKSQALKGLCDLAQRTSFYMLDLTTVGLALAVTIIEQVTGKRLPMEKGTVEVL